MLFLWEVFDVLDVTGLFLSDTRACTQGACPHSGTPLSGRPERVNLFRIVASGVFERWQITTSLREPRIESGGAVGQHVRYTRSALCSSASKNRRDDASPDKQGSRSL